MAMVAELVFAPRNHSRLGQRGEWWEGSSRIDGLMFLAVWGQRPKSWEQFSLPGVLLRSHVLHSTTGEDPAALFLGKLWHRAHRAFEWIEEQVQD